VEKNENRGTNRHGRRFDDEFKRDAVRMLKSGGRLLLTDAGVITGPISNEEVERRSINGYMQFVPPGVNEELLEAAGFRLIDQEDRTGSVVFNASGRLRAMLAHRTDVEAADGKEVFARQQRYVETVVALSERRALSRIMYFAELAQSADMRPSPHRITAKPA
jgi:hypothetical protein